VLHDDGVDDPLCQRRPEGHVVNKHVFTSGGAAQVFLNGAYLFKQVEMAMPGAVRLAHVATLQLRPVFGLVIECQQELDD
jgi:hypothetical protein